MRTTSFRRTARELGVRCGRGLRLMEWWWTIFVALVALSALFAFLEED